MNKKYFFSLFIICQMVFVSGCNGGPKAPHTASSTKEGTQTNADRDSLTASNTIKLDESMMANIKVEEVSEKPIPTLLTVTGKVQCNEDRMTRILAPVSGQILNIKVKTGDTVQKGDILFYMKSREAAAAISEYLASTKDLDLAEKNYAMIKDLFEHQAASRISLQQAENELAKSKLQTARAEESLRVLGIDVRKKDITHGLSSVIPIRASINGTVIEKHVTEGQFVQPDNNPLLTIADLSTLWILADVYERDLHLIKLGQKAEVTTAAYPELCVVANIIHINDLVDPITRTVKVRFLISDSKLGLKPEMFASIAIFLDESARVLLVPEKAVFNEGGQNFVYVGTKDSEFSRKQVEVSSDGPGLLRVLSGLKPGEKVVSEGALLLNLQAERID